jgi:hypothetical protein
MPKLVLMPTLDNLSRDEVEAYIETVRAKRMVATLEFFQTKNRKVELKQSKIGQRIQGKLDMLEKEIDRLEAAENKVSTRLAEIEQLKHEFDATGEEYEEVEEE